MCPEFPSPVQPALYRFYQFHIIQSFKPEECTWISSNIKIAPTSSHFLRSALSHSSLAAFTPPSPCIGSTITAHVSLLTNPSSPSRSFSCPTSTLGIRGSNGFWYLGLLVTLSAPMLRPWNDPSKHTIRVLPQSGESHVRPGASAAQRSFPTLRTILSAPSFASVPELAKNTFAPPGCVSDCAGNPRPPSDCVRETSNSASFPDHSWWYMLLV